MRILMLTGAYTPAIGGIEVLLARDLIPELTRRGHVVSVLTSTDHADGQPELDEIAGVPVFRSNVRAEALSPGGLLRARKAARAFMADCAPDVVHSHDLSFLAWQHRRVSAEHAWPLVATVHNVMTSFEPQWIPRTVKLLDDADWITGVSGGVVDDVRGFAPHLSDRTSLVLNAITPWPPTDADAPTDPTLLCLGTLVARKGFDRAIDAFAKIAPTRAAARLVIAGDGELAQSLRQRAAAAGVGAQVEFVGAVDPSRTADLMRGARAVVLPSRYEGLPLVALEARWASRPLVVTRSPGGLEEVVDNGETGFVVDGDDVDAMSEALAALLDSTTLASTLGRRARAVAEASFSLEDCASAYEVIYDRVRSQQSR